MTSRWLSMYDKTMAKFANQLNRYNQLFEDKQQQFKFCYHLIPSLKYKRLQYIKKTKKDKTKEEEFNAELYARNNFMSQREAKMLHRLTNQAL